MSDKQRPADWPSPDAGPASGAPRYTPPEGYTPNYPPPPPEGYRDYNQPGYPPPYTNMYGYQMGQTRVETAPATTRLLAYLIDSLIVGIPAGIINGLFALIFSLAGLAFWNWNMGALNIQIGSGFTALFWGIYAYFCYFYFGGNTLGKKIMGIRVVNEDGSKPSATTFILHFSVGYFLNGLIFGLGYLWALWDANGQTWGQKVFRTRTVAGNW